MSGAEDITEGTPKKRNLAFSHAFGSSGLSQKVRIVGSAKRPFPIRGTPGVPLSRLILKVPEPMYMPRAARSSLDSTLFHWLRRRHQVTTQVYDLYTV